MNPVQARLEIAGRVQGVGYRAWFCSQAISLGLTGWVRNNDEDGTVCALVEGDKKKVEGLVALAKQGPRAAKVEDISVSYNEYSGAYLAFEITR